MFTLDFKQNKKKKKKIRFKIFSFAKFTFYLKKKLCCLTLVIYTHQKLTGLKNVVTSFQLLLFCITLMLLTHRQCTSNVAHLHFYVWKKRVRSCQHNTNCDTIFFAHFPISDAENEETRRIGNANIHHIDSNRYCRIKRKKNIAKQMFSTLFSTATQHRNFRIGNNTHTFDKKENQRKKEETTK